MLLVRTRKEDCAPYSSGVRSHNDKFCVNYDTRKKIILTYITSKFILQSINYSEKKGI